jgi:hypothetical protein
MTEHERSPIFENDEIRCQTPPRRLSGSREPLDPFELTRASQIPLSNGRYKFVVSRSKIETKVTRICYP